MRIEIKAMVRGKPAYCVVEIPDLRWVRDDATAETPADTLPDSIQRLDLVDNLGKRVTLR
jgi:hypothetical protein